MVPSVATMSAAWRRRSPATDRTAPIVRVPVPLLSASAISARFVTVKTFAETSRSPSDLRKPVAADTETVPAMVPSTATAPVVALATRFPDRETSRGSNVARKTSVPVLPMLPLTAVSEAFTAEMFRDPPLASLIEPLSVRSVRSPDTLEISPIARSAPDAVSVTSISPAVVLVASRRLMFVWRLLPLPIPCAAVRVTVFAVVRFASSEAVLSVIAPVPFVLLSAVTKICASVLTRELRATLPVAA